MFVVPNFSWQTQSAAGALESATQVMLNKLWDTTHGRLLDAHKRGIRPSPLWKGTIAANFAQKPLS